MRKEHIDEYISDVKKTILEVISEFPKVASDTTKKHLLISKVGFCLIQMRVCLDYATQDIYAFIIQPGDGLTEIRRRKIQKYFPYGKNENDFKSSVGRSLPKLKDLNYDIYKLIESLQPFKSENNWLCDLCLQANNYKHDSPKQKRKEHKVQIVGGAIKMSGGTVVLQPGSSVNGVRIKDRIDINMDTPEGDVSKYGLDLIRITETSFVFEEGDINVIDLLQESISKIDSFVKSLYEIHLKDYH